MSDEGPHAATEPEPQIIERLEHPYVAGVIPDFCVHRDDPEEQRCGYPEDRHVPVEAEEELTPEAVVALFSAFITTLEPADLEGVIKAIEEEPLPAGDDRRPALMNRADRVELVRLFLALRSTGRAIVRRLEDDELGKLRSE